MAGSGLFQSQKAVRPHSMPREVEDLRNDVKRVLAPMVALTVEEYTNPAAADPDAIMEALAVVEEAAEYSGDDLDGVVGTADMPYGRNITVTTSGDTPADAPATATITGLDLNGNEITEDISVPQTATIAAGSKIFKSVTSVAFTAGDGTDAAVAVGFGDVLGITKTPVSRAGLVAIVREVAAGALVTTGALSLTNKSYTPAAAPDASKDYAIIYEYVPELFLPPE